MATLHLEPDQLLTTTRAVRKRLDFDRPVPRELVEECLEIAIQAPSGSNGQPWRWLVVTDPDLKAGIASYYRQSWTAYNREFAERGAEDAAARATPIVASASYLAERFHEVPVMIIACLRGRADGLDAVGQASRYGSVIQAGWSLQLAARARSLGTCWTTLHLAYEREVAELLGLPYDDYQQVGLITLGYSLGTDFKPAARRPLDRVVRWERWEA